jgi:hypothetical protein
MDVLGGLFEQIGNITTPLKLVALFACVVLMIGLGLIKRNTDLNKRAYNLLMTLFVIAAILALAAMFIHPPPPSPGTYTLTVTATDAANTPYRTDQAKVTANNAEAAEANSTASNTWSFHIHEDDLPKDRRVLISASTNDHEYFANEWDTLTYDPNQTKVLMLAKAPVTSFSLNVSDTAISNSLEKITPLKNDPDSKANKIVITYDPGSITADNEGIYSMTSSNPIVIIDGHRFVLTGCTVPPPDINVTRHSQDLINYAKQESISRATSYLKRNPKVLAQWLTSLQH